MTFYQIFLPAFSLVFILQVFVIRSVILWKKTGVNPFVFGKTENAHDYIGRVYKVMTVGTWIAIGSYSFLPDTYQYLMPMWYLESAIVQQVGVGLLLFAFIWIIVAQFQMSNSWRIGINYEETTKLIDHGLFGVSRNPIFLGVLISYVGTFLVIPNALTFSLMAITFISIQVQVRMEEEYLQKSHGEEYNQYQKKVRRWV
jgi:protein-S-isoprenylcysteine O-methyltransferase Ste14